MKLHPIEQAPTIKIPIYKTIRREISFGESVPKRIKYNKVQMSKKACPEEEIVAAEENPQTFTENIINIELGNIAENGELQRGESTLKRKLDKIFTYQTQSTTDKVPEELSSFSTYPLQKPRKKLGTFSVNTEDYKKEEDLKENIESELSSEKEKINSVYEFTSAHKFKDKGQRGKVENIYINQMNAEEEGIIYAGLQVLLNIKREGCTLEHLEKQNIPEEVNIKEKKSNKTIILDLDKTLIQVITKEEWLECKIPILISKELKIPYIVRRGAILFVQKLASYAELILYSAATLDYITDIINGIPAFRENIKYILSRENCGESQSCYLKSTKIINRDLENIIIVEDSYWVYPQDLDNVVPVLPFDMEIYWEDRELEAVLRYILSIIYEKDVRIAIKEKFGLSFLAHNYFESMNH